MTIHLQAGTPPWLGNSHAELVEQLHFHDLPLIGITRLNGQNFLFRCVIGEVEPVNVWTYTPLTAEDLVAIDTVDEGSFDEVVLAIAGNGEAVAVAFDGYGIIAWTEWSDFDSPKQAMEILSERMAEFIAGLTEGAESAKAQAERLLAIV